MTPELRRKFGRQRFDVSHLILRELRMVGYTGRSLGMKLGVSASLVSATIRGDRHSPLVLDTLRELGIKEELLFDPNKMGVA